MKTYGQVVDSIEALPAAQQQSLLELVQRRLAERRREALVKSVHEARKEFKAGKIKSRSVETIIAQLRQGV